MTKTVKGVLCLLFNHAKKSLTSGFFVPRRLSLFACAAAKRADLAFTTTVVEDTHLTLTVFLFKVEANNSLIILLLQTYERKFAGFPFLFSL